MQSTNTPFWLEIKSEYLDANLEKVIQYLAKESYNKEADAFYEETVHLLTTRVLEVIRTLSSFDLATENAKEDREFAVKAIKILGSWILIQDDRSEQRYHEAFFFFVMTLITMLPQGYCEDLSELAVKSVVQASVETPGFSWSDMKDLKPEILAHKMLSGVRLSEEPTAGTWFQGKGSLHITEGMIEIYECNRDEAKISRTASSLMIMEQRIMVQSAVSERIIQSEEDDLEAMHNYTIGYLRAVAKTSPSPARPPKRFAKGETVMVRYLGKDKTGNLLVETVDEDHERISGIIPASSKVYRKFYTVRDVSRYLTEGDCFGAEYRGGDRNEFDIEKSFIKQMIANTIAVGREVPAVLRTVNEKGLMSWWTRDGYPAYVASEDDPGVYASGDTAELMIENVENNGYVYAIVSQESNDLIDEEESKRYCVEGFINNEYAPAKASESRYASEEFTKGLCRLLLRYQRVLDHAPDRFRVLCVSRILARMTGDIAASGFLSVMCDYLRNLVFFAKGQVDKIRPLAIPEQLIKSAEIARRQDIVNILREYGSSEDSVFLSQVIDRDKPDAFLLHLAKLVQSGNRIQEVYPAVNPVIRREIARFLAVETEDRTDLNEIAGPDLGVENSRTEFKTSFFFAPKNANEQLQEKNVFRVLCSFLNTSEGGILYLGVNNNGGIDGIETDLRHLGRIIKGSYKEDIDSYIRYITDKAKIYFDLDVRVHFHIEPAFENRVVIIRVDPYEYGVVELDGIPYIRVNNESVKMSQKLRRQISANRITRDNGLPAKIIVALQDAIKEKLKVRLLHYSSNSGNCRDRLVEPFYFVGGNRFVWCFDLEEGANKLFRITRIGNIQITDEKWTEEERHHKGDTDIFYLTGNTPIRVKLELDTMARNLLIEEFPESIGDITQTGEGSWLLDTRVFQMYGVGRFYTGLAEHIRIVDSPELEAYAKDYFARMNDYGESVKS